MPTIEELEAMTEEERKAFAEKVVESLIESMKNGEPIDDDE
jgi:hypothetical protein